MFVFSLFKFYELKVLIKKWRHDEHGQYALRTLPHGTGDLSSR
jgi:hypothetical protein